MKKLISISILLCFTYQSLALEISEDTEKRIPSNQGDFVTQEEATQNHIEYENFQSDKKRKEHNQFLRKISKDNKGDSIRKNK